MTPYQARGTIYSITTRLTSGQFSQRPASPDSDGGVRDGVWVPCPLGYDVMVYALLVTSFASTCLARSCQTVGVLRL